MTSQANRSCSSTPTSYERLTLRLTPVTHDHKGVIRISAKNTPVSTHDAPYISRNTPPQWNGQLYNPKQPNNNTHTSIPSTQRENILGTSGKLIRSQVKSCSRNWQAECAALKQTLDYYKNRILELESTYKEKRDPGPLVWEKDNIVYKLKLEEFEQRMGEENAYLRKCMTHLNDQLEQNKQVIPGLHQDISHLQASNLQLNEILRSKTNKLNQSQECCKSLREKNDSQSKVEQKVNERFEELQWHIRNIEGENQRLARGMQEQDEITRNLQKVIEEERAKSESLLSDCLVMQKEISARKHHISDLQDSLSKERITTEELRRVISNEEQKSLLLSKNLYLLESSSECEPRRLRNSECVQRQQNPVFDRQKDLRKSCSTTVIHEYPKAHNPTFRVSEYQEKSEEFKLLGIEMAFSRIPGNCTPQKCLQMAEYFHQASDILLAEKSRLVLLVEKYKKLLEFCWEGPSGESSKPVEFVNELIEKCNLYESSVYEKKSTIKSLQREIEYFRKATPKTSRERHFSVGDEVQRQRLITNFQRQMADSTDKISLNRVLQNTHTTTLMTPFPHTSVNGLTKIKAFKPAGMTGFMDQSGHNKLKNISGEDILKEIASKIKDHSLEIQHSYSAITESNTKGETCNQEECNHSISSQSQVAYETSSRGGLRSRRRHNMGSIIEHLSSEMPPELHFNHPEASNSSFSKQKKRRLDEITDPIGDRMLATLTLRLCEAARKMVRNNNFTTILPDSVYLINYSQEYLSSLKVRVLETPPSKTLETKKYWSPQNLSGAPFSEASLVWNIGIVLDQIIHRSLFFKSEEQISGASPYVFRCVNKPFFKALLQLMLAKDVARRILLKEIETRILEEEQAIFN